MKIKPPDIDSDVLFRQLLQTPRPIREIPFKFPQSPEIQLVVRALSSSEIYECKQNDQLICKSLYLKNGRKAFNNVDTLELLTFREYQLLHRQITEALTYISPTFLTCDYSQWLDKLTKGAEHPSNFIIMHSLGQCFQYTNTGANLFSQDFPERYFSIPRNELLDGHWMTYLAARRIYKMRNDL